MDQQALQELKRKLEREGEQKVKQLYTSHIPKGDMAKMAIDIIAQGDKEFKEKTGRSMTYAEMRNMYG